MRTRVGIAIQGDTLRAVAVRRGVVQWWGEHSVRAGESVPVGIAALLRAAPHHRGSLSVVVAFGVAHAQVKQIEGLPPLKDDRVAGRVVGEGVSRFFLRDGGPLVTSAIRRGAAGTVWAAAFDQSLVAAVVQACEAARVRLSGIVPSIVAVMRTGEVGQLAWHEGDVLVRVGRAGESLRRVERLPGGGHQTETVDLPQALAVLGPDGSHYLAAYGATLVPHTEPLSLRPGRWLLAAPVSTRRAAAAIATLALGSVAAFALPVASAAKVTTDANSTLATLGPQALAAQSAFQDLERVTAALHEVAAFRRSRRLATSFLREVTAALPDPGAIVSLRTDSVGGTVVVLAPSAARVVQGLEAAQSLATPEIEGPVTRERAGDQTFERVTVRFQFRQRAIR